MVQRDAVRAYGGVVILMVLGAPGSGKTTFIPLPAGLLPDYVVLDGEAFTAPAAPPGSAQAERRDRP